MPTGLQVMVLAGVLVGVGVVTLASRLVPPVPDAADVLARLSRTRPRAPVPVASAAGGVEERIGLVALRHLPSRVWALTPTKELALLRRTPAQFYGEKVIFALVGLIGVPLLGVLVSLVAPLPWPVPVLASLGLAAGLWFLPNLFVADDAKVARADFTRALGAYIDLVAMERATGAGPRQAMETAAQASDIWVFSRIGEELARSRWSGQAPWDALHVLSEDLGLPELDDVADIMRLSGEEGAQVYATLRARSAALRHAMLTTELGKANEANERMTMPASFLGIIFLAVILGPALMRLVA